MYIPNAYGTHTHQRHMTAAEVPGSPIFIMALATDCRHLEVQLFGDEHGNVISLYGRDCSVQVLALLLIVVGFFASPVVIRVRILLCLYNNPGFCCVFNITVGARAVVRYSGILFLFPSAQRRHQKIFEEAPTVIADPDVFREMVCGGCPEMGCKWSCFLRHDVWPVQEKAAVRLGKLVGYRGAGTVEYLFVPDKHSMLRIACLSPCSGRWKLLVHASPFRSLLTLACAPYLLRPV